MRPFRCLPLLFPAALAAVSLCAQDEPKAYRLFVGVDLMVKETDDDYRPVDSLTADEVVFDEPGRPRMRLRDSGPLSWSRQTKIGRAPIVISDFSQHRAFTLRNDKAIQYMATQNNMVLYQQERVDAARAAVALNERVKSAWHGVQHTAEQRLAAGLQVSDATMQAIQQNVTRWDELAADAHYAMIAQMAETDRMIGDPTLIDRAVNATGEAGADVLELTFSIAAENPVANAYVVVMGAVTQDEEKGVAVFHHPIGAIGPTPRKIHIRKTGFKPGFTIEDVKLHVYTHGKELATNLSERAVGLTRDQAREFLLLSHLADHAADTIGPEPVWTLAPAPLLSAKSAAAFDFPAVVNIDADGSLISIHDSETAARAYLAEIHDAADIRTKTTPGKSFAAEIRVAPVADTAALDQTGRLPAQVVAAMREMIFLPAVEAGTPVAATTTVNLADFFR